MGGEWGGGGGGGGDASIMLENCQFLPQFDGSLFRMDVLLNIISQAESNVHLCIILH